MYLTPKRGRGRHSMRGLGTTASNIGTSLVFGSDAIARRLPTGVPARPVGLGPNFVPNPVTSSSWGSNPPRVTGGGAWQDGGGSGWQTGGQTWQNGGASSGNGWSAGNNPYGSSPTNPSNSQALAAAQALLASNPSLLTQSQFTMLQQSGLVSTSLPYSSVSSLATAAGTSTDSGIDPATGVPYATELADAEAGGTSTSVLDATYAGLPVYLWLIIGGGAIFLISKRGR